MVWAGPSRWSAAPATVTSDNWLVRLRLRSLRFHRDASAVV
ncbi:MAG: hypothetical protein HW394_1536 [Acidobacteria bacterium]|nr:hypothetical protein [Acidobacteriota bacterium]